jgi:hypothetical protein
VVLTIYLRVQVFEFEVWGLRLRVGGLEFKVRDEWFRIMVWDEGFRLSG